MAAGAIPRREPLQSDVEIEILYRGVCHSDVHQVRDDWREFLPTQYPCVPGHEIVGRVTRVGSAVRGFAQADLAAVGCMVRERPRRAHGRLLNGLLAMLERDGTMTRVGRDGAESASPNALSPPRRPDAAAYLPLRCSIGTYWRSVGPV